LGLPEQSNQIEGQPESSKQPPVLRAVPTERRQLPKGQFFELPLDPDIIARHLAGEDLTIEAPEPPPESKPPQATVALIAAAVALAVFAVSIWIALR
jgi:hypothetical protein